MAQRFIVMEADDAGYYRCDVFDTETGMCYALLATGTRTRLDLSALVIRPGDNSEHDGLAWSGDTAVAFWEQLGDVVGRRSSAGMVVAGALERARSARATSYARTPLYLEPDPDSAPEPDLDYDADAGETDEDDEED